MSEPRAEGETVRSLFEGYAKKWLEHAVMVLPLGLTTGVAVVAKDRLMAAPWMILWVVVPLFVAALLSLRLLRVGAARIDWRWFVFLGLYCSAFALAGTTDLLAWKRTPTKGSYVGLTEESHRWLVPLWFGDWRYGFARPVSKAPNDLVVILRSPVVADDQERRTMLNRLRDRELIDLAKGHAKGVAFDATYDTASPVDALFCRSVRDSGFNVIATYDLTPPERGLPPRPPTRAMLDCLQPKDSLGHAMGFAETDETVRSIPLLWEGDEAAPAFSMRIANLVQGGATSAPRKPPRSALLRFMPPEQELHVLRETDFEEIKNDPKMLDGYFVIVGDDSPADRFKTPFGLLSGAAVHAYAVRALMTGNYIDRPPALYAAFILLASCYVLTLLAARGAPPRRLAIAAAVLSAVVFGLAAAAMYFFSVWVDVIYAVAAIWLLVPLLLGVRRKLGLRTPPVAPPSLSSLDASG